MGNTKYTNIAASAFVLLLLLTTIAMAGDPNGSNTYTDDVAGMKLAVNFAWTLIGAFLVFFMQAGFAFLGAGALRVKNTVNYFAKSYMDFSIGALAYWAVGFALMFGGSKLYAGLEDGNSIIGWSGWFLSGNSYDVSTMMFWMFQVVFAATAATIVAGACAERMKLQAYLIYSGIVTAVIYAIYGHWVWGGGWLATLPYGVGVRDFAGSGVVHAVGGMVALAGIYLLGPRIGKFNKDGVPNAIPGHDVPMIVMGTFFLFFGWFGFNPASTLAATDLRISVIAVNTFLAGAAGATLVCYYTFFKTKKVDIALTCNGALAGLVGITASCAYVPTWAAVVIGVVSGFIVMYGIKFNDWVLKVDDPVGAVAVHGYNGLWGLLTVGIFADGTYGGVSGLIVGNTSQIIAQLIDMVVVVVWAFGTGYILFYIIKKIVGLRVSPEEELTGLDLGEHGYSAYPEFVIAGPMDGLREGQISDNLECSTEGART
ncbi:MULTISPECIES: ammonium transporter [Methanothrix]|jgi:ammonium transporter, Amt family|uniref:Ammonium transporter n=3 Tax=root TaxID=1 RepID=A0A0W8FBC0_9ZZZZ|nr:MULTISPECIES: ammonium transporter [Methanothrix]HNX09939.1 ammonium transporter [Methanothrix sp.]MCK9586673.1 ammonium transporter [Methanothrix soehngenii]MDD5257658.1 ammonium transporter [Methanothrix soehngenii]MDD5736043.1 ammonium transporter [Methanothrix soehngenii]HOE45129.1 ammonium transporter [Methanothrix soehngenii]